MNTLVLVLLSICLLLSIVANVAFALAMFALFEEVQSMTDWMLRQVERVKPLISALIKRAEGMLYHERR